MKIVSHYKGVSRSRIIEFSLKHLLYVGDLLQRPRSWYETNQGGPKNQEEDLDMFGNPNYATSYINFCYIILKLIYIPIN